MHRGRGWARFVLALGLGVAGMASMVAEPICALAQGHFLGAEFDEAVGWLTAGKLLARKRP
jgi:hypothetical protein